MSASDVLPGGLRWVDAGNAGPFTLEGTRTFLVGLRWVAVIDPGPALDAHVDAVARAVAEGAPESVVLLLTHGHRDHSGAAAALASRLGAPVLGAWAAGGGEGEDARGGPPPGLDVRPLRDGARVATDAGDLVAVRTPGHAREHVAFAWPDASAVFVGDLLLGRGETTWVGEYPGCVADYLASLDRVDALGASLLLPTHGPAVPDPAGHIARYRAHRLERVEQVRRALERRPDATLDELMAEVYGRGVPAGLDAAARASLAALVEHARGGPG